MMKTVLRLLARRPRAASAITYALLLGLVSVVAIGSVTRMGAGVERLFGTTSSVIAGAVSVPAVEPIAPSPPEVTCADPVADSLAVGTVCDDGTVFAGMSPDGNVAMFATRCDAGQSWDGSACSGTRQLLSFNDWDPDNDGTLNDSSTTFVLGAIAGQSNTAGEANTVYHAGRMDSGSPYYAAQYCQNLIQHGQSDWYLPAQNELNELFWYRNQIGGFYSGSDNNVGGKNLAAGLYGFENYPLTYWSSTELGAASRAAPALFTSGYTTLDDKYYGYSVRCVRR